MIGLDDVSAFVHSALPPAPARVLEVGAGGGELAAAIRASGYEVVAIDPDPRGPDVRPVPLHEVDEPAASFDAAVAVISMHHVDPLGPSCGRLAELVRPGGAFVLDEFDVEAFDVRAARWWLDHREPDPEHEHEREEPDELVGELRDHLHSVRVLAETLGEWFALETPVRGPYLYRWGMPDGLRDEEARLIADGVLPATGARLIGKRR